MGTHVSRRLGTAVSAAAVLSFFQPAPALAAACMGADPAIVSVAVKGMQSSGGLNRYTLSGKVANLGSAGQAPNTLQFVDIYKGNTKLDSRGVPPLRAGQSYAFEYVTERSAQAGEVDLIFARVSARYDICRSACRDMIRMVEPVTRAFSSEGGTGSCEENASEQESGVWF